MAFKKLKKFNTLSKDQLREINAGVDPDCEGGTVVIKNGVLYCEYYEVDPDNIINLDDCLMGS